MEIPRTISLEGLPAPVARILYYIVQLFSPRTVSDYVKQPATHLLDRPGNVLGGIKREDLYADLA